MDTMEQKGLDPIASSDLVFTDEVDRDRICTRVVLFDYSWMNYLIEAEFYTKSQGILSVCWDYFGSSETKVTAVQSIGDYVPDVDADVTVTVYTYDIPSDLFAEQLKGFLQAHMKSWDSAYAFDPDDRILQMFNHVLTEGKLESVEKKPWQEARKLRWK